jgi:hypothetical protein
MLPFYGQTHTVTRRVERFIDESSGEMIEMKSDAIILDGVVCSGYRSENRWFCARAIPLVARVLAEPGRPALI